MCIFYFFGMEKLLEKINPAIEAATQRKQKGNEALMKSEAVIALHEYTHAMTEIWGAADSLKEYLTTKAITPQEAQRLSQLQKSIDEIRIVLLCNQALASIKLGQFQQAIEFCTTVLSFHSTNQKALFRRGFAKSRCGDLIEAEEDFKRLLAIDPENADALKELRNIKRIRQEPSGGRFCSTSGLSWDSIFKACSGLNRKEKVCEMEMTKIRS